MNLEQRAELRRPWRMVAGSIALSSVAAMVAWFVSGDIGLTSIAFLVVFITAGMTISMLVMTVDISALNASRNDSDQRPSSDTNSDASPM